MPKKSLSSRAGAAAVRAGERRLTIPVWVLLFVVVVAIGAGYITGKKFATISAITTAQTTPVYRSNSNANFANQNWQAQGGWIGTYPGACRACKNLIDSIQYGSSFYNQGSSETIVASASILGGPSSNLGYGPYDAMWEFWFNSASGAYPTNYTWPQVPPSPMGAGETYGPPGPGFVLLKQWLMKQLVGNGGGGFSWPSTVTIPAAQMAVYGNYIGVIHVRLWVHFDGFDTPFSLTDHGWYDLADQEANLQPGFGFVSVNNAVGQNANVIVQVGDKLQIQAQTGVSCSMKPTNAPVSAGAQFGPPGNTYPGGSFSAQCGWLLRIRNFYSTGNTVPPGWTDINVPDFALQNYNVPITSAWFTPGVQNVYIVQLFNSMNLQSWGQFATVDNASKAPSVTSVNYSPPGPWSIGQTVTINATGQANSVTKLPIVSFGFVCSQGSTFILNTNVTARSLGSGSYGAEALFTVSTDKIPVQCQVTDFDGQRNGVYQPQYTVVKNAQYSSNPPCPPGWTGTYPACTPGSGPAAIPAAVLWLVIGLIVSGGVLFLFGRVLKDPLITILVQVAGLVLLGIGFALAGYLLVTWLQAVIGSWNPFGGH